MITKTIHNKFQETIDDIGRLIGKTPLQKIDFPICNLFTKLELYNPFGSIKDRPAFYIIKNSLTKNLIKSDTIVVESTSGNFGIALASICKRLGIKFIPVIDPFINPEKEKFLNFISTKVVKVDEPDNTGGYLLNRIKEVKKILQENENCFNPNQYENPNNYLSYYNTLGVEISDSFDKLQYAFIAVSSGGTIIGLSKKLKEKFPSIKIVGVDIEGSLIFSNKPKKRRISGIGSSIRSPLMDKAKIDDVLILTSEEIIEGTLELYKKYNLFLGPTSGAAYFGAKKFLTLNAKVNDNAIFISPDGGESYKETIYSDKWVNENIR